MSKCTCQKVSTKNIMPGWMCCFCKRHHGGGTYNDIRRERCKHCGHQRAGLSMLRRSK